MVPNHAGPVTGGSQVAEDRAAQLSKQLALESNLEPGDPSVEFSAAKAVANALSPAAEKEIMTSLCKSCCKRVRIIYEIAADKLTHDVLGEAVKPFGLKPGKTYKKDVPCPNTPASAAEP
jgi:hypothetical protein